MDPAVAGRAVVLVPITPSPAGNGLAMRAWAIVRSLERLGFGVDVVVLPVAEAGPSDEPPTGASDPRVVRLPLPLRPTTGELTRFVGDPWGRSVAGSLDPELPAIRHVPPAASARIVDAIGVARPDLLIAMRLTLWPIGAAVGRDLGVPLVVDLDDDEQALATATADLRRAAAIDRLQHELAPSTAAVTLANPDDADRFDGRLPCPVRHLPNVVPEWTADRLTTPRTTPGTDDPNRILFVGNLTYGPNERAAEELVAIRPIVQARLAETGTVRVDLVGPASERITALGSPEVHVTGRVTDLAPWYSAATLVCAPLRTGSGSRIKLLEAFALQVPVVTTPIGASGLAVAHQDHVLLGETKTELAEACVATVADGAAAARRAGRAARYAATHHTDEPFDRALGAALAGAGAQNNG